MPPELMDLMDVIEQQIRDISQLAAVSGDQQGSGPGRMDGLRTQRQFVVFHKSGDPVLRPALVPEAVNEEVRGGRAIWIYLRLRNEKDRIACAPASGTTEHPEWRSTLREAQNREVAVVVRSFWFINSWLNIGKSAEEI
ncbi:hypothetical protein AB0G05_43755 [Nonomuraea wenchangensis]